MRKYLLHVLIISFVFLLAPTAQVASYAGEIEDAREEVRNNPDDAEAHYNLGVTFGNSGKYQEAIEPLKQATRLIPNYVDAQFMLGCVYVAIKDRDSALEQYRILKRLNSELANELLKVINE